MEGVRSSGIPHFRRHHCGHGIGLQLYEQPFINANNEMKIEEGSVVVVETPYYEIGVGGFIVEDTLQIKKNGVEFITHSDRNLYCIAA